MGLFRKPYMLPDPLPEQMKLQGSFSKLFLILIFSIVFVLLALWMLTYEPGPNTPLPTIFLRIIGIVALLLGLGGGVVSLGMLFGIGTYLQLVREGFTVSNLGRKRRFNWLDVSEFSVGAVFSNKMILFDIHNDDSRLAEFNRKMVNNAGSLPNQYRIRLENLVTLMNAYRDNALVNSPAAGQSDPPAS